MHARRNRTGMRIAVIFVATAAMGLSAAARGGGYSWQLPRGFPEPAVPADNPMNEAKVTLGARLFNDQRLSVNGEYSCQSCHAPGHAFTDGRARSRGATGATLELNAPTLFNVAYSASLGWSDTGVRTLEQQMRGPMFNEHPPELGLAGREAHLEQELAADADVAAAFAAAFPGEPRAVTVGNVIRAIAAYERTLFAGGSAFDRYVFGGDHRALDAAQKRGMELFFSARSGCSSCHAGINFSGPWIDHEQRSADAIFADTGTGKSVRVPTLRNLSSTGPYMHDGRFATLGPVFDQYERLAADPAADPRLQRPPLTTEERADLQSFLQSLDEPR